MDVLKLLSSETDLLQLQTWEISHVIKVESYFCCIILWNSAMFLAEAVAIQFGYFFFFLLFTIYSDVYRVAPLPCRRLTPVNCTVWLLGCLDEAAWGSSTSPFLPAAGHFSTRGCGPFDDPSMKAAVVTTFQRQILILIPLRRVRRCSDIDRGIIIWDRNRLSLRDKIRV